MKHPDFNIDERVTTWIRGIRASGNVTPDDADELESHLRDEIDALRQTGLTDSEAFLIAIRRMGSANQIAREFYKVNGRRLWKYLEPSGLSGNVDRSTRPHRYNELSFIIILTILSAFAAQIPYLFGLSYIGEDAISAIRQVLFLFFPCIACYMICKRNLTTPYIAASIAAIILGFLLINLYPYGSKSDTLYLSLLHLALLYWALFGFLYIAHGNRPTRGYVDFLRFSGELFIYTVLVVLGGGVLLAVGNAIFGIIGIDISMITEKHLIVAGAFGAPIVGSYLVEAKREIIENIAPVLAKLFIPLFFLVILVFLIALLLTGASPFLEREPLIILDLLLFLVLAMVFYSVSSRSERETASIMDYANIALLAVAIVVDLIALSAIVYRLSSYGISPNKLAALGENVLLLVHLSALLIAYTRYTLKRDDFEIVERWTARYIPVYIVWFVFVVAIMPPLFGFK